MFQRNATATLRPLSNHRSVKSGPECLRLDLAIILGPIGSDWHSVRQVQDVLLMASKNMENHGKSEIAFQWVSTRYNNYPPNMTNSKAVVLRLILLLSVFVCACVLRALWAEVATLLCIYLTLNASYLRCPLLELFLAAQGWGDSETAPDIISYNTCISSCGHWPVAVQLQQLATSNQLRQGTISVEL